MFTGIVQTMGSVAALTPTGAGVRLEIDTEGWVPDRGYRPALGDSIAVSGVCLTLAAIEGGVFGFDVISETLAKTSLGRLERGSRVNLEPAVLPTQPMGGHFVQGHVDGVGAVTAIDADPADWRLTIRPPASMMAWMVAKGSVCIDGVSLTLADRDAETITIALIPTTLEVTTLGSLKVGDTVNLEGDVLVKAIGHTLRAMSASEEPVDMDLLKRAGFGD
ncbi:riboflavin synthase [Mucisphaera calidilacus]|uniref:Riboflavin synthase n=1 Tax=Mucisphaera calidilacus TaxID=2527982 RepID=A0A518BWL6_9BACT|nr:riboflavin synthase [Mucisphaera calidilacus]QDU71370.1 Riboflavin synthase [Mucisphaera calidilacus]